MLFGVGVSIRDGDFFLGFILVLRGRDWGLLLVERGGRMGVVFSLFFLGV